MTRGDDVFSSEAFVVFSKHRILFLFFLACLRAKTRGFIFFSKCLGRSFLSKIRGRAAGFDSLSDSDLLVTVDSTRCARVVDPQQSGLRLHPTISPTHPGN